ncbi:unnamed protein product [Acanthoscelides obtectus]|uniref:Uncharacterized protein n=1 Tax=Acanthoscelides obtectus TaxID=200917 RepID=A0A9P0Q9G2_ACAOB|nr:unnamed protein product [Acanthoscelides obtectus]CAK1675879.1 hypothetical protein AOBTE_LOCUS30460 [Acanthoscelides obtectus]
MESPRETLPAPSCLSLKLVALSINLERDFESRFEDILTLVIPPWIINPYGDIEQTNVIIQEELTELSTKEELKVQFKNGYQQFWLQNNIPVTYPTGKKPYSSQNKENVHALTRHLKISSCCTDIMKLSIFTFLVCVRYLVVCLNQ